MKTSARVCAGLLLAVVVAVNPLSAIGVRAQETAPGEEPSAQAQTDGGAKAAALGYAEYKQAHAQAGPGGSSFEIQVDAYAENSTSASRMEDGSVLTAEEGTVEWAFTVPQSGFYHICIDYLPVLSKGGTIERALYLDGSIPFAEARNLTFSRAFQDDGPVKTDVNDNHIRPKQVEVTQWMTAVLRDPSELVQEELQFYLEAGQHVLKLESLREQLQIRRIQFLPAEAPIRYEDYLAEHQASPQENAGEEPVRLEAEQAHLKSDSTIYMLNDRSPSSYPQSPVKVRYNTIGGDKWEIAGQWIEWEVAIPADGYYQIATRFRQDTYSGGYVSRRLTIDGELPFQEASSLQFMFGDSWQTAAVGGEEPYLFYLTKGVHTIRMNVTMGAMASTLDAVDSILDTLNRAYLSILVITGSEPDVYRDYNFTALIPDVIEEFAAAQKQLQQVVEDLNNESGMRGSHAATLEKLIITLGNMVDDPESIAQNFTTFKDDLTSVGTWLLDSRLQPLELDALFFIPQGQELPDTEINFWQSLVFQVQAFFLSFVEDYNSLSSGVTEGQLASGEAIKVWIATGRDQSMIIQQLADQYFTPDHNVKVNLQLVAAGSILPSILGGTAPDVTLSMTVTDPLNYAIRHAVTDLTEFPDLDEVLERFSPSVLESYTFEGQVFALPETMSFPMMFVRTDIFEQLGISPPETWDDFYSIISVLQRNRLQIGFPTASNGLKIFLYQAGGELYNSERTASALDSEESIESLKTLTDLFLLYGLPVTYDFANRFRSGEMPLGIADYTMYNQLTVFAPDIKGLWQMYPIPGTVQEDGTIQNASPCTSTAVMMLSSTKNKENAWEFMKWWTSKETQIQYSVEMESILGPSAKQPVSNMEALDSLPWSPSEYKSLATQMKNLAGTPELPGGYYTDRTISFIFTSIYNNRISPDAAVMAYIGELNEEITRKRNEFGLK